MDRSSPPHQKQSMKYKTVSEDFEPKNRTPLCHTEGCFRVDTHIIIPLLISLYRRSWAEPNFLHFICFPLNEEGLPALFQNKIQKASAPTRHMGFLMVSFLTG
jgi:hypothetical protein